MKHCSFSGVLGRFLSAVNWKGCSCCLCDRSALTPRSDCRWISGMLSRGLKVLLHVCKTGWGGQETFLPPLVPAHPKNVNSSLDTRGTTQNDFQYSDDEGSLWGSCHLVRHKLWTPTWRKPAFLSSAGRRLLISSLILECPKIEVFLHSYEG